MTWPTKTDFVDGDVLTAAQVNNIGTNLNEIDPTGITDGYVVTADGAGGIAWEAVNAESMTQIATGTLSTTFTISAIPGTYKDIVLVFRDFESAGTQQLDINVNGVTTSSYDWTGQSSYNGQNLNGGLQTQTKWRINQQTFAATNTNGQLNFRFFDYAHTDGGKMASFYLSFKNSSGTYDVQMGAAYYRGTGAITSITVTPITNNFTSGTYILYGVK